MKLTIEIEQEEDGRWIAEVLGLSGVTVYGDSQEGAVAFAGSGRQTGGRRDDAVSSYAGDGLRP